MSQDLYELLFLRGIWTSQGGFWTILLFGTNVTDEQYEIYSGAAFLSNNYNLGAPPSWGVQLGYRFWPDRGKLNAGASRTPGFKGTYRSTILLLLVLVYTFNFIDRMIVATLGQAIKVDLQISDAQLGLLQGLAFAICFTTVGIPLARLAERVSRVNLIAVCLAVWSGMTALCGAAANYTQLFLCRMGVGIGEAGCLPPAHSLITDLYAARSRATALSIYSLGIPLGTMFGAMAGGWIADELGWRLAFLIVGLPGVVLAVVFKIVVKEPQRGLADGVCTDPSAAVPPLGNVVRQLFGNASFVHILVGATLIGFVAYGTGTFTQPYLHRAFGLSYTQVGLFFGLIGGAAAAAGTVLGGVASDWAGRRALRWYALIPGFSVLLAAPGYVLAYTRESPQLALACLVVPMLLHYVYIGPTLGVMHNLVGPRMRATAIALFIFIVNLIGLGAGPYVTGRFNDYFAEREFLRALGGSFAERCPGGIAPAGSGDVLVLECARSGMLGTRAGIVITSIVLVWAALHYLLSARTLRRDLVTASARAHRQTI